MPTNAPADRFPAGRAPRAGGLKAWLLCGLLVAGSLGGAEAFWRSRGWEPSITDDAPLRAAHRDRALAAGPGVVALLGASRMQLGFDPETFAARYPGRPLANLSAYGEPPAAVLFDLAERGFGGTALVSFTPGQLTDASLAVGRANLAEWDATRRVDRAAAELRAFRQNRAVVLQQALGLKPVLRALLAVRRVPEPPYVRNRGDRHVLADYRLLAARGELAPLRRQIAADTRPDLCVRRRPPEWDANARRLAAAIDRIEARGGRVALVAFPMTGPTAAAEEVRYPKAAYWDRLGKFTDCPRVHFRDAPALSRFDCPDDNHLDKRDAPAFTAALLDELDRRGTF